jgi:hypothetical protein
MQHGHLLSGLPDEFHVVLDHQDGVILRHALEELCRFRTLFTGHASDWFVEEQQRWVLGHHHADLQPLHLTMGQRPRLMVRLLKQAKGIQNGGDLVRLLRGQ